MMGRLFSATATAAAATIALYGIAGATSTMGTMHAASAATVHLTAQHHSGQAGTAVLTQKGSNVVVRLTMSGLPAGVAEPAHIHPGTCAKLNPAPRYPLTNATNGTTTTTIHNVRLASLLGGKYAINVHNAHTLSIYVACGDIK
ncbi:MAG TPA: CHRD domain-containing protein [Candidatus Dormibacteraeota bacterium]|nr:CHRD domain-containing protein [Candidatus Dormibacteraeota bacterium]